jgi:hypothetical protein
MILYLEYDRRRRGRETEENTQYKEPVCIWIILST